MAKALAKGSRITGAQRTTLASQYAGGTPQATAFARSLTTPVVPSGSCMVFWKGGVQLRGRGGAARGAKKAASSSSARKGTTAPARKPAKAAAKKSPRRQPRLRRRGARQEDASEEDHCQEGSQEGSG